MAGENEAEDDLLDVLLNVQDHGNAEVTTDSIKAIILVLKNLLNHILDIDIVLEEKFTQTTL